MWSQQQRDELKAFVIEKAATSQQFVVFGDISEEFGNKHRRFKKDVEKEILRSVMRIQKNCPHLLRTIRLYFVLQVPVPSESKEIIENAAFKGPGCVQFDFAHRVHYFLSRDKSMRLGDPNNEKLFEYMVERAKQSDDTFYTAEVFATRFEEWAANEGLGPINKYDPMRKLKKVLTFVQDSKIDEHDKVRILMWLGKSVSEESLKSMKIVGEIKRDSSKKIVWYKPNDKTKEILVREPKLIPTAAQRKRQRHGGSPPGKRSKTDDQPSTSSAVQSQPVPIVDDVRLEEDGAPEETDAYQQIADEEIPEYAAMEEPAAEEAVAKEEAAEAVKVKQAENPTVGETSADEKLAEIHVRPIPTQKESVRQPQPKKHQEATRTENNRREENYDTESDSTAYSGTPPPRDDPREPVADVQFAEDAVEVEPEEVVPAAPAVVNPAAVNPAAVNPAAVKAAIRAAVKKDASELAAAKSAIKELIANGTVPQPPRNAQQPYSSEHQKATWRNPQDAKEQKRIWSSKIELKKVLLRISRNLTASLAGLQQDLIRIAEQYENEIRKLNDHELVSVGKVFMALRMMFRFVRKNSHEGKGDFRSVLIVNSFLNTLRVLKMQLPQLETAQELISNMDEFNQSKCNSNLKVSSLTVRTAFDYAFLILRNNKETKFVPVYKPADFQNYSFNAERVLVDFIRGVQMSEEPVIREIEHDVDAAAEKYSDNQLASFKDLIEGFEEVVCVIRNNCFVAQPSDNTVKATRIFYLLDIVYHEMLIPKYEPFRQQLIVQANRTSSRLRISKDAARLIASMTLSNCCPST